MGGRGRGRGQSRRASDGLEALREEQLDAWGRGAQANFASACFSFRLLSFPSSLRNGSHAVATHPWPSRLWHFYERRQAEADTHRHPRGGTTAGARGRSILAEGGAWVGDTGGVRHEEGSTERGRGEITGPGRDNLRKRKAGCHGPSFSPGLTFPISPAYSGKLTRSVGPSRKKSLEKDNAAPLPRPSGGGSQILVPPGGSRYFRATLRWSSNFRFRRRQHVVPRASSVSLTVTTPVCGEAGTYLSRGGAGGTRLLHMRG